SVDAHLDAREHARGTRPRAGEPGSVAELAEQESLAVAGLEPRARLRLLRVLSACWTVQAGEHDPALDVRAGKLAAVDQPHAVHEDQAVAAELLVSVQRAEVQEVLRPDGLELESDLGRRDAPLRRVVAPPVVRDELEAVLAGRHVVEREGSRAALFLARV